MDAEILYGRVRRVLPHSGEVRRHDTDISLLITRNDIPYTMISLIAKEPHASGWVNVEVDGADATLHHPRNLDLVARALDHFGIS